MDVPESGPSDFQDEAEAMIAIGKTLAKLTPEARGRVVTWAIGYFEIGPRMRF